MKKFLSAVSAGSVDDSSGMFMDRCMRDSKNAIKVQVKEGKTVVAMKLMVEGGDSKTMYVGEQSSVHKDVVDTLAASFMSGTVLGVGLDGFQWVTETELIAEIGKG